MDVTTAGRVPVTALGDIQRFLEAAEHLKALTLQLQQLQCRQSRRQVVLAQQITVFTTHCGELAHANPRLAELWKQTQDELHAMNVMTPPPLPSGSECSKGGRGSGTTTRSGD